MRKLVPTTAVMCLVVGVGVAMAGTGTTVVNPNPNGGPITPGTGPNGSTTTCVSKDTGAVRVVNPGTPCNSNETQQTFISSVGAVQVFGPIVSNPANSQTFASVACPANKNVTGGGVITNGGLEQEVNQTAPSGNGWGAFTNNLSGHRDGGNDNLFPPTNDTLQAVAVCANP